MNICDWVNPWIAQPRSQGFWAVLDWTIYQKLFDFYINVQMYIYVYMKYVTVLVVDVSWVKFWYIKHTYVYM